jgi:hypothetical protein
VEHVVSGEAALITWFARGAVHISSTRRAA